jgi:hypothetical protein
MTYKYCIFGNGSAGVGVVPEPDISLHEIYISYNILTERREIMPILLMPLYLTYM